MRTDAFLGRLEHDRIVAAIRDAEGRSSGEIRVHVAAGEVDDVEAAARRQFESLGMTATALRNGILIYVAPRSQRFAILGDTGIHERCGPAFWKEMAAVMEADFREGRFTDGLVKGVARAGEALGEHFPRTPGAADVNELPDQVTED